jgi:surfeit locus 1 family protein
MPFRPTLWPTLFTIPTMILLLGLGTWQLERLQWKEALIADRSERTGAPPIALPAPGTALSGQALDEIDYRHATASGRFLHDREMYLAARTMEGSVGYQIVTPLQLADGAVVLVNRGWLPDKRKDPATRMDGQVAGTVTVDGAIRAPRQQNWLQGWIVPDNDPAKNFWFWNDLAAMGAYAGVPADRLVPVYLEAGPAANPGGVPIGGQTKVNLPNDHLQYAITWYLLAMALAVIYVLYHRRPRPVES